MNDVEKNPIKIIWKTKSHLLPLSIWFMWLLSILIFTIITFAIPDNIIRVNFSVLKINNFITISISALAFVISMYSFGRGVYTEEDLSELYIKDIKVYYSFLSDYLFSGICWLIVLFFSAMKLMIVLSVPIWFSDLSKIVYLSLFSLALISVVYIVIKNMNRVTNKVIINAYKIKNRNP